MPVDKNLYLNIISFINGTNNSFPQIKEIVFFFKDHLVWSGLEQEDIRVLYRFLIKILAINNPDPDSIQSDFIAINKYFFPFLFPNPLFPISQPFPLQLPRLAFLLPSEPYIYLVVVSYFICCMHIPSFQLYGEKRTSTLVFPPPPSFSHFFFAIFNFSTFDILDDFPLSSIKFILSTSLCCCFF